MTQRDPRRLRALFDRLFEELQAFPTAEVRKIELVLQGGEFLIALENLTTQLDELDVPVPASAAATILELAALTGLDPRYTDRLDL